MKKQTLKKQKKSEPIIPGVWEYIGFVGVDSGQVLLVDPCYLGKYIMDRPNDKDPSEQPKLKYSDICAVTGSKGGGQIHYDLGHPGAGVVLGTAYGDGTYPVQVKRNKSGRIIEARIIFE